MDRGEKTEVPVLPAGTVEAAPGAAAAEATARPLNRRAVTAALLLVMVLASVEQTVTSTAMPTIIGALHGLEHYSWVAAIYLLACTVSMPLIGRLADSMGRKRVILFSIGIFVISSMLAATARTMPQLIVFRGLQGIGAGGIMPVVLTILGDIFTIEERARIQGLFSAVWGTASLAGPLLGWFLVTTLGWQSIFFVNVPLGLIAMAMLMVCYHDQEKPHRVDLDLPGVISIGLGCMTLLLLVSHIGPQGWSWPISLGLAASTVLSLGFFAIHERRAENPVMPMNLMMNPAIGPSLLGSGLLGIGFLSLDTFVPLYVQGGRGGGAGAAAWVVTPVMLTWALSGVVAAPLVVRRGFRETAVWGSILVVVGFSGLLICSLTAAPRIVLGLILAVTGLGFGPASMCFFLAAQNAVEWKQRGMITSSIHFFRTVGGALGIGVLGAMFNIISRPQLRSLESMGITPAKLLDPHTRQTLSPQVLQLAGSMISSGLKWVFVAMLAVSVLQVIVSQWLPARKGQRSISALQAAEAMA